MKSSALASASALAECSPNSALLAPPWSLAPSSATGLDDDDAGIELGDELLEEDDDVSVPLEELTDVPSENEDG